MSSSEPTPITYYSWFAGEDFLSATLPNYEMERRRIVFNIIAVIIIFIFVLPYFLATKRVANASSSDGVEENTVEKPQILSPSKKTHNNKRRNGKKDKQQHKPSVPQQSTHTHTKETKEVVEFSSLTSNMLTLLALSVYLVCYSLVRIISSHLGLYPKYPYLPKMNANTLLKWQMLLLRGMSRIRRKKGSY